MLPVVLCAARKFTGHWSPHSPHTAVSSVNCVGISRTLKSTCQGQNKISTSFLSIIYDNLYQYQPMMSLTSCCRHRREWFFCHWLKVSRGLLLLFSSWNWRVQNYPKNTIERTFLYNSHRSYIYHLNTFIYQYISQMLNQMLYIRIFLDFFCWQWVND